MFTGNSCHTQRNPDPRLIPESLLLYECQCKGLESHSVWPQCGPKEMFSFVTNISHILQHRISKIFHRLDARVFVWCRFYQIRTALRVSPKLPVKVEVNLPRNQREYALMSFIQPSKIIAFSITHFWDWNSKSVQMFVNAVQACGQLTFNFVLLIPCIDN
jgi:hypothetical protein